MMRSGRIVSSLLILALASSLIPDIVFLGVNEIPISRNLRYLLLLSLIVGLVLSYADRAISGGKVPTQSNSRDPISDPPTNNSTESNVSSKRRVNTHKVQGRAVTQWTQRRMEPEQDDVEYIFCQCGNRYVVGTTYCANCGRVLS